MKIIDPKFHNPASQEANELRELARCDREIERICEEARAGIGDAHGIYQGLRDWRTEKKLILEEGLNSASVQGFKGVVRSCKSESAT